MIKEFFTKKIEIHLWFYWFIFTLMVLDSIMDGMRYLLEK